MSKKLIAIVAGAIITTQALSMVAPTGIGTQSATASEKGDIVSPIAEEPIASKVEDEKAPVVEEKVNEVKPVEKKVNEVKQVEKKAEVKTAAPVINFKRDFVYVPQGFKLSESSISHLISAKTSAGQVVDCKLDLSKVDSSKMGDYNVKVTAKLAEHTVEKNFVVKVIHELDKRLDPVVSLNVESLTVKPEQELKVEEIVGSVNDHLGRPIGFDRIKLKDVNEVINKAPSKPGNYIIDIVTQDLVGRETRAELVLIVTGKLTPPALKLKQTEVTITADKVDLMQYVESCIDEEDGDLLAKGKVMFFNGEKEVSIIFLNEGMNDVVFSVTDSDGMNTKATLKVNYKPNGEVKPEEEKPVTPPVKPEPPTKPEEEKPSVKPEEEKPSVKPEEEKPSVKPEEDKKPVVKPEGDKKPAVKPSEDKKPEVKPNADKPKTGDVSVFGSLALGVASLGTALLLRKKK